jgi:hypothetical protein
MCVSIEIIISTRLVERIQRKPPGISDAWPFDCPTMRYVSLKIWIYI